MYQAKEDDEEITFWLFTPANRGTFGATITDGDGPTVTDGDGATEAKRVPIIFTVS